MTIIGAVFGAVGTAGQRCTSTRRLIIHDSIYDKVKDALVEAYAQLRIGNPLDENNHVGPLIDKEAVSMYKDALEKVVEEGGHLLLKVVNFKVRALKADVMLNLPLQKPKRISNSSARNFRTYSLSAEVLRRS